MHIVAGKIYAEFSEYCGYILRRYSPTLYYLQEQNLTQRGVN